MTSDAASWMLDALICIDDTDNLDSPGTGELLEAMVTHMAERGWVKPAHITRHQLLIHPDIAYTSHNSSMCCRTQISPAHWNDCIQYCSAFLEEHAAPGSDPGLCFVNLDHLHDAPALIDYGRQAKSKVLDKAGAGQLARLLGIHLSEHGGSGIGIIGALAGAGLRLEGNDGRMRGHLNFAAGTIEQSIAQLRAMPDVERIQCLNCLQPMDNDRVLIGDKPKTVQQNGRSTLLLQPAEAPYQWRTCTRQELKKY